MFQPVIPADGLAGWAFLQKTRAAQETSLSETPAFQRDAEYFASKIGNVLTAEELVSDRRLLAVALGAFGLDEDIGNTYFIRRVLEEGTLDPDALANKLSDERYAKFSQAFGFGDYQVPRTVLSTFADEILTDYRERSFENAIGEQDNDMRLALNLSRELTEIAESSGSESTKWFRVMGNTPVRTVVEAALGLPTAIGSLDIDRQLEEFEDKTAARFADSSVSQFADPEATEKLVRLFLLRRQAESFAAGFTPASAALALLQS